VIRGRRRSARSYEERAIGYKGDVYGSDGDGAAEAMEIREGDGGEEGEKSEIGACVLRKSV
jgi:hypothetical protein